MKKVYTLLVFLFMSLLAFTQTKTDGVSAPPVVINASDKNTVDYFPSIINLHHPVPASDFGNKKEELNKQRDAYEQSHTKASEKKTRATAIPPTFVKGWQGNAANGVPNDNDIAVSNGGKVLSVVNSNMVVYDDTGAVLHNRSLTALFTPVGSFSWISDPRVLYDPNADKFILVCFTGALSTDSKILVAFSQTNDPAANWNCYTLNGASFNDSTWSDYPIIAISDKDLFMTFNQVKDNVSWTIGFKQSVIWQIAKQEGFAGTPLQYSLWSDIKYNGGYLRNICPAKYQTTTMGNNMYFLTLRNVATTNDSVFVTEVTDSKISGNAQLVQKLLITPTAYGFPPNARQKKVANPRQYLMTNDARVLAAVYENDYVHFGSNTITSNMNAGVYLGTIKNISTATPLVKGDIITSTAAEYGYPSMAYLGQDHKIMYTFSHCYKDSFPGTSVLYKNANEDYSDVQAIKNGLSIINMLSDSNERWGDYTNIQKLYDVPNRAYVTGSWSSSSAMRTWIGIVDNIDFPNSTNSISSVKETMVFPNPTSNKRFRIKFSLDETQYVDFYLYNMQGQRVSKLLRAYSKSGENEFSFDVSPLAKGNYILKLEGKEKILSAHQVVVE
jgi:Secretion system C-terminal sorting domain